jgi:hypothetical protein
MAVTGRDVSIRVTLFYAACLAVYIVADLIDVIRRRWW